MSKEETPATYYFTSGAEDARHGPYSGVELKRLAKQGILKPTDMIWQAGSSKTTPAAKVKGLFAVAEPQTPTAMATAALARAAPGSFAAASTFAAKPVAEESPPVVAELVYEAEVVEDDLPRTAPSRSGKPAAPTAWLEDPMREIAVRLKWILWKLFFGSGILAFVLWLVYLTLPTGGWAIFVTGMIHSVWLLFSGYLVNLVWWRAFAPRRTTDVFYLRSFQNDAASWPIRVAIQEALGDEVRVSGIRDPRRRIAAVSDGLSPWLKAMRHCTPKFMDLEAEEDWKSRLWNTLQHGKMALVDLSVTTPFVLEEVRLVTRAIGVDRTIFLGTLPQTEKEIRRTLASHLDDNAVARARVFLWPGGPGGFAPSDHVRQFREELKQIYADIAARPPITATQVPPEYVIEPKGPSKTPMSRVMLRWMIGFQLILVGFMFLLTLASKALSSDPKIQNIIVVIGAAPLAIMNSVFFFWNFFVYIRDVGIFWRRVKAVLLLGLLSLPWIFMLYGGLASMDLAPDQRSEPSRWEVEADLRLQAVEDASTERGG